MLKSIPAFPGYAMSTDGRVRNTDADHYLKKSWRGGVSGKEESYYFFWNGGTPVNVSTRDLQAHVFRGKKLQILPPSKEKEQVVGEDDNWRSLPESRYLVSREGEVKNSETGYILTPSKKRKTQKEGYFLRFNTHKSYISRDSLIRRVWSDEFEVQDFEDESLFRLIPGTTQFYMRVDGMCFDEKRNQPLLVREYRPNAWVYQISRHGRRRTYLSANNLYQDAWGLPADGIKWAEVRERAINY